MTGVNEMIAFPQTLVFRQYGDDGRPLPNGYVVEREATSQEDKDSHIREMNRLFYELESVFPKGD